MQQSIFIARLKPEFKSVYIEAHNNFAAALREKYLAAGIQQIRLFLRDDQLVMIVDADDFEKARTMLAEDQLDQAWQLKVGPMKNPDFQAMEEIFRLS